VARVLDGRTAEIEGSGLRLDASLQPTAATGDPRLVERLVDNLLDNAIRHNEHGGWITVSTNGGAVSVANSGTPISAQELERITQPFGRGAGERRGRADSHGLGLSIVQAIAAAHGAAISVSAPSDGGLRVKVQFPADARRSGSGT
jgi:signal transduction histidine kinase